MTNYKITNITNTAGKRSARFNSSLDIDYVDEMRKKTVKIKPGETVFLRIHSLPLSVHKLRVRKLVSVVEVSSNEVKNNMNIGKPVAIPMVVKTETLEESEKTIASTGKKKTGKKLHESEVADN